MAELKLTPDQERAVSTRGSALLVSAAAGSGKTRVLVERLMRRVAEGADIDSFLIITYTRAAAAELRTRIMKELSRLCAADPENRRLRRQTGLCYRAQIGTIHSFCAALLRENSHLLGLNPSFRVAEEDRAENIKAVILDRLLEELYDDFENRPGLKALIDTVGAGRDDSRLASLVLELHTVLKSHPYPEKWAEEQLRALSDPGVSDAGETPWGRYILNSAAETAAYWSERMEALLAQLMQPGREKLQAAYGDSLAETAYALRTLSQAAQRGWEAVRSALPVPFPHLKPIRGGDELASSVKAAREACKKACESLESQFSSDSASLLAELRGVYPAMEALLKLTFELDAAFTAEKRRQGLLDYSDLEHLSLRILVDAATGEPTELARSLSLRYSEIMVDEYQDVSEIQDRLFMAVSREGKNLFMVGDVKQSIYRFRLAEPRIFIEKLLSYGPADAPEGEPRRVLLQENFRSRGCILRAVNHVFENLMSARLGEVEYDESACLRQGRAYLEAGETKVEMSVLTLPEGDGEKEPPDKVEQEAAMVARQIRTLVEDGAIIAPDGTPRRAGYGDIVILLRSPGSSGEAYRRALAREGVPAVSRHGGGFFQSLEVTALLSLLAVIDNPRQDVPLISVLRSPLWGFTADELAAVRTADREGDFYTALNAAAAESKKCADFLCALNAWRELAPDLSVEALIGHICAETDLFALCASMPDGAARRENVQTLMDLARQYEADGYRGLFGFPDWLRRLAERGEEPRTGVDSTNAVRIMSIHKSKGLEFPIVFLADTGRQFNRADQARTVLVHPKLGLGPKVTDTERGIEYPSLARRAIALRIMRESLSEELRVLYVAMTRACERLYISCAWRDPEKVLSRLREGLTAPVAPQLLETDSSMAQWLARAALLGGEAINLRVCSPPEAAEPAPCSTSMDTETEEADEEAYAAFCRRMTWVYPYKTAETLPSKVTAAALGGLTPPDGEAADILPRAARAYYRYPDFGSRDRPLTGAEKGVATHLVLQLMDLRKSGTAEEIASETARLASLGHLTEKQAEAVDTEAILRFFLSETGRRVLAADRVWREFRFSLLCPANNWFDAPEDEEVLLQGVADCCIEEGGVLTIIDYKTDYVPPEGTDMLVKRYEGQLRAYAGALARIFGKPVREGILYFLRTGEAVSIAP